MQARLQKCPPKHEKLFSRAFASSPGDEIVISGMAGRFPKSANVAELFDNLYNKVSLKKKFDLEGYVFWGQVIRKSDFKLVIFFMAVKFSFLA
jgi:hypothetical protein